MEKIVFSKIISNLRELISHDDDLLDGNVFNIADSPYLSNLEKLDISSNTYITDVGVRYLCKSPYIKKLKHLDLSFTMITNESVRYISESPNFQFLEQLDISGTECTGHFF